MVPFLYKNSLNKQGGAPTLIVIVCYVFSGGSIPSILGVHRSWHRILTDPRNGLLAHRPHIPLG
jgi:hypothetical protein